MWFASNVVSPRLSVQIPARLVTNLEFARGAIEVQIYDWTLSIGYGRAVGAAVFAGSLNDGGHQAYLTNFPPYAPPVGPGLWIPLPGQAALQPYWHVNVEPFAIPDASVCAPDGPLAFSEGPGSDFYAEALEVYEVGSDLTPEQVATAIFWADGPGTIWGTGHSMNIATQLLEQEGASLETAAHLYAQAGIAQADSIIGCWYSKYRVNLIRPLTYIRDVIDPVWTSALFPTPPFPEYTSAHSVQSAAVGQSLDDFYAGVALPTTATTRSAWLRDPIRITGRLSRRPPSRVCMAASTSARRSTRDSIRARASPIASALSNGSTSNCSPWS
jgi:hypothetical protein